MVDALVYFDSTVAKTVFKVCEDNLFCKDGVMEETGLIENMAQTCAARTSFKQRFADDGFGTLEVGNDAVSEQKNDIAHGKTKIGVLVMIQSLEIKRCPLVGEVLETMMTVEEEFFLAMIVRSEVQTGGETIATCKMKLLLTDKIPAG